MSSFVYDVVEDISANIASFLPDYRDKLSLKTMIYQSTHVAITRTIISYIDT